MTGNRNAVDKRRIQDDAGDVLNITSDGNIVITDLKENEVDDGKLVLASHHQDSLAAGSGCTVGFSTCTVHDIHVTIAVNTTGKAHVEFREEAVYTGGVAITKYNMNRQLAVPCSSIIFVDDPNVTNEGTLLLELHSGSSGWKATVTGTADMGNWILKKNTKYIVKVTNSEASDAIDLAIVVTYYSHS